MRRYILPVAAILLTAACGTSTPTSTPATNAAANDPAAQTPAATKVDASAAFKALTALVPSVKLTGVVTAANDGNHLLGRPGQYTSKITFSDSRIPSSETAGLKADDVSSGGSIEAFDNAADAQARAKYVEAVTKSVPAFAEYDYLHGTILIRVSQLLTPDQAATYKTAVAKIG